MSCTVNVLTNAIALGDDTSDETIENFKESLTLEWAREDLAEKLRSNVAEWLEDYYKGAVEYVKEYIPNTSSDSDEFILGVEHPEKIREIVENWNLRNAKNLIREFEKFEAEQKKCGFNSLSEYLESKVDPSTGTFSGITYPASFYSLRKALDAADDMFTYDSPADLLFVEYEDEKDGRGQGIYGLTLDEPAKAEVLAHPERYAFINICYD